MPFPPITNGRAEQGKDNIFLGQGKLKSRSCSLVMIMIIIMVIVIIMVIIMVIVDIIIITAIMVIKCRVLLIIGMVLKLVMDRLVNTFRSSWSY